ncbi:MAG: 50S ribosomal protein L4 [candidate division CPR1 bacterium GW2011_GWA2_42_17]|uniref:Large ribosomal subunit protein uL4 n=1 Tax=candidate division CPR1 bacterium GW2011_GWA2_42_17 TaxID=1618341 RepID=A0A0G1C2P4_9BACT|nr:MAG: 50S ribosomal protein L4 [candidate division CPR1 bacterium GW2011_GWA2_42_17]
MAKNIKETISKTISAPLYDEKGQKSGEIGLNTAVFGAKPNFDLMAQAVLVSLGNQRLGLAKVKTRGEVSLTTRKMYAQKHTGRARHGAASAPIFVGGGVAHGPKPGKREKFLNDKMKKMATISALSQKWQEGKVAVLEKIVFPEISTKKAKNLLQSISPAKKILLVEDSANKVIEKSCKNLPWINVALALNVDILAILNCDSLILEKSALSTLEKRLLTNAA